MEIPAIAAELGGSLDQTGTPPISFRVVSVAQDYGMTTNTISVQAAIDATFTFQEIG